MFNLVSKITLKKIGAQPAADSIKDGQPVRCAQIYGFATAAETKQSAFDQPYTVFSGNFEAVNLATGEIFKSGSLIIPPVIQNLIAPAVAAANGSEVAFSVEIGAKYSAKGSTHYEYTAVPLVESSSGDALADLREQTKKAAVALLEAPKTKHK